MTKLQFTLRAPSDSVFAPSAFDSQIGRELSMGPTTAGVLESATVAPDGSSAELVLDVIDSLASLDDLSLPAYDADLSPLHPVHAPGECSECRARALSLLLAHPIGSPMHSPPGSEPGLVMHEGHLWDCLACVERHVDLDLGRRGCPHCCPPREVRGPEANP